MKKTMKKCLTLLLALAMLLAMAVPAAAATPYDGHPLRQNHHLYRGGQGRYREGVPVDEVRCELQRVHILQGI